MGWRSTKIAEKLDVVDYANTTNVEFIVDPGGGGVLPYMGYKGTCRGIGYEF